jgi:hypothetical protein
MEIRFVLKYSKPVPRFPLDCKYVAFDTKGFPFPAKAAIAHDFRSIPMAETESKALSELLSCEFEIMMLQITYKEIPCPR